MLNGLSMKRKAACENSTESEEARNDEVGDQRMMCVSHLPGTTPCFESSVDRNISGYPEKTSYLEIDLKPHIGGSAHVSLVRVPAGH